MLTWLVFMVLGMYYVMVDGCERDNQCQRYQVCCGDRCKSWPKCFLNTNKECFYDTHCVKGKVCVDHVCILKAASIKCATQDDCRSADPSYDCCQGKCLPTSNCTKPLEINSTSSLKTKLHGPVLVFSCKHLCPTGFICVNRTCLSLSETAATPNTIKKVKDGSSRDSMTTGLLSAALFSGAVLISFVCFCFLKETKYYKRFCYESQERTRESLPTTCPRHHQTMCDTTRLAHGRLPLVYPSFNQPPPSYDEAIKDHSNNKC